MKKRRNIFAVSVLLLVVLIGVSAQTRKFITEQLFEVFHQDKILKLQVESVNDFSQIFLIENGTKKQLTAGYQNHFKPFGVDDFAVWIEENLDSGVQQVVLYQFSTNTSRVLQLNEVTINQDPQVNHKGQSVWQGWSQGSWQIFWFDGQNTTQITQGDVAISPRFKQNQIQFLRKDAKNQWRIEQYSIWSKTTKVLEKGENAKAHFE